jgi:hypothetical protein
MAAAVLSIAMLIGLRLPGLVSVIAVAALALAMVSSFPYAKLARIVRLPARLWLVPLVGVLLDYRITFVVLVGLYLLSGPVLWLRTRRQPVFGGLVGDRVPAGDHRRPAEDLVTGAHGRGRGAGGQVDVGT